MDNSFEEVNRARCFNHTMHLSVKTLLQPFNAGLSGQTEDDEDSDVEDNVIPPLGDVDNDEEEEDEDGSEEDDPVVYADDGHDELNELDEAERADLLKNTASVRQAVTKVRICLYSFYTIDIVPL